MALITKSTIAEAVKTASLDTWAVAVALLLALLIRLGIIPKIPW